MPDDENYIKTLGDQEMAQSLRLRFWAVRAVLTASRSAMEEHLASHFDFIREQGRAGRIFASGPLLGEDGSQVGEGLLIFRGESKAEIQALFDTDPLYIHGIRTYEIREWQVNVGVIQLSVDIYTSGGTIN